MLTGLYIETLLVDEELADQVWEAWHSGEADEETACIAWMLIAGVPDKLIQIEAIQPMPSCAFSMAIQTAAKP